MRLFGILLLVIAAGLTVGVVPNAPSWWTVAGCVGLTLAAVTVATLARVRPAEGTETGSAGPRPAPGLVPTLLLGWVVLFGLTSLGLAVGLATGSGATALGVQSGLGVLLAILFARRRWTAMVVVSLFVLPTALFNLNQGGDALRLLVGTTVRAVSPGEAAARGPADVYRVPGATPRSEFGGRFVTETSTGSGAGSTTLTRVATAVPLVARSWSPDEPISMWVVCEDATTETGAVRPAWLTEVYRGCAERWSREGAFASPDSDVRSLYASAVEATERVHGLRSAAPAPAVRWIGSPLAAARARLLILATFALQFLLAWPLFLALSRFRPRRDGEKGGNRPSCA